MNLIITEVNKISESKYQIIADGHYLEFNSDEFENIPIPKIGDTVSLLSNSSLGIIQYYYHSVNIYGWCAPSIDSIGANRWDMYKVPEIVSDTRIPEQSNSVIDTPDLLK